MVAGKGVGGRAGEGLTVVVGCLCKGVRGGGCCTWFC